MRVCLVFLVAAPLAAVAIYPSVVLGQSTSSAPARAKCPVANAAGTAVAGEPIDPPITFQANPQTTTKNFGADRKSEEALFKLTTESALPNDIEKSLELVADPILRVGETTDSASFPEPTFSTLRVLPNRKTISFRVCLAPDKDLPAGKYVGTVALEGPPGVDSSTMNITANAKDGGIFVLSSIASLLLAFFILLYKGANDERTRLKVEAEKMPNKEGDTPTDEKAAALEASKHYLPAAWTCLKDFGWIVPTLVAIGAAFGALWGAYDANPSWGEAGPVTSAFAVIGAGLAAIGAKTIFTGVR